MIMCDSGHKTRGYREAAIEISQHGSLSPCKRCGKPRHYFLKHKYSHINETHDYELDWVLRLYSLEEAELGYDPMFFVLRHRPSNEMAVWPFFWARDKRGKWRVGQFPPILPLVTFKEAVKMIDEYKAMEPYPPPSETPFTNHEFRIDWMLGKKPPN